MKKKAKVSKVLRSKPAKQIDITGHEFPKSVTIEKVDNGLTVRQYGMDGQRTLIAKNHKEALKHAKNLLK